MPAAIFADVVLLLVAPFVGSFLGVVIRRLPAGSPVLLARSRCPHCHRRLEVRDLVPLVSWLLSRGHCRACGARLGGFYPGIELAALAVGLWAIAVFPGWLAWASCGLGWTLLTAAEIDRRHYWLPDVLTLPLIPGGLLVLWLAAPTQVANAALGAVIGYALLAATAWIYLRLRGREGLGLGDAKLFAAAGAWTTWSGLPSVLLIAALAGLLVAGAGYLRGDDMSGARALPFGPFLAGGLWLVWSFGPLVPVTG